MQDYTREQLWKLYKGLPEELKEAAFSDKTTQAIYDICDRNGITEEKQISEIIRYVGKVMFGILHPENLQYFLEKELEIEIETAKKIHQDIHDIIFRPIKKNLDKLYGTETPSSQTTETEAITEEKTMPRTTRAEEETSQEADSYRESIKREH